MDQQRVGKRIQKREIFVDKISDLRIFVELSSRAALQIENN